MAKKKDKKKAKDTTVKNTTNDVTVVDPPRTQFGQYTSTIDMGYQNWSNLKDLLNKYRAAALFPEMQYAMEEIKNSVFITENEARPFSLKIRENNKLNKDLNKKIENTFDDFYLDNINLISLFMLHFDKFYVEGRLILRKHWDKDGKLLNYIIIDPTMISRVYDKTNKKYIWKLQKNISNMPQVEIIGYDFNTELRETNDTEIIADDDIIYVDSGKQLNGTIISHIHMALKPLNQLNQLKDHLLIYRIVRAPERLVFYVDTGDAAPKKSKAILNEAKNNYNYKLLFNKSTGELDVKKSTYAMIDNIWLSRNNGRSTEVSSIGGNMNLGSLEDLKLYYGELYRMLHLPLKKLDFFSGGREIQIGENSNNISSDENNLRKFTNKLRSQYAPVFIEFFIDYCVSNKLFTENEIDKFENLIILNYNDTADYTLQFKFALLKAKLEMVKEMEAYIGAPNADDRGAKIPLFSVQDVWKNVMAYSDERIIELQAQLKKEKEENIQWPKDDEGL